MKRVLLVLTAILLLASGCGHKTDSPPAGSSETAGEKVVTVGFSQLGAESDWRRANTESMREAFAPGSGFELILEDGQQKQANQFRAIRTFIQREVDYIVLAPVTETGWDTVLEEAKEAGIPVILVDRKVRVEDDSLYACWVGSDFELEGRKAVEWLHSFAESRGLAQEEIYIANIQGTLGASAQIGRTKSLKEAAENYGWNLLAQIPGDFTQAKGREVMETILNLYPQLNVVYCENDNEAMGAIEAIEAAGKKAGSDIAGGEILVISFDGVKKEAMEYVREDTISCIAECNPLQGPLVRELIETLEAGGVPEKYSYVEEGLFSGREEVAGVEVEGKEYPVSLVTRDFLEERYGGTEGE